jgi:hypothetical protein
MAIRRATEARILEQIPDARRRARAERETKSRAVTARFDPATRRIEVGLSNGCWFGFPADLGQGLQGASDEQLAQVEVAPGGIGLHWECLDADLLVSALLHGIFGTRRWMQEVGRRGGQARSPAKIRAARENGRKGGRPPGPSKAPPRQPAKR